MVVNNGTSPGNPTSFRNLGSQLNRQAAPSFAFDANKRQRTGEPVSSVQVGIQSSAQVSPIVQRPIQNSSGNFPFSNSTSSSIHPVISPVLTTSTTNRPSNFPISKQQFKGNPSHSHLPPPLPTSISEKTKKEAEERAKREAAKKEAEEKNKIVEEEFIDDALLSEVYENEILSQQSDEQNKPIHSLPPPLPSPTSSSSLLSSHSLIHTSSTMNQSNHLNHNSPNSNLTIHNGKKSMSNPNLPSKSNQNHSNSIQNGKKSTSIPNLNPNSRTPLNNGSNSFNHYTNQTSNFGNNLDLVSTQFTPASANEIQDLNEKMNWLQEEVNRMKKEGEELRKQITQKEDLNHSLKLQKNQISKQLEQELDKSEKMIKREKDLQNTIRTAKEDLIQVKTSSSFNLTQVHLESEKTINNLRIQLAAEKEHHNQTRNLLEAEKSKIPNQAREKGLQGEEKERMLLVKKLLSDSSGLVTLLGDNLFSQFNQGPRNRLFIALSSIICDELQQPSLLLIEIESIILQRISTAIVENSLSTLLTMVSFNSNCRSCFTRVKESLPQENTLSHQFNLQEEPLLPCQLFDWLLSHLLEFEGDSLCKILEIFYSICWNNPDEDLFIKFEPLFKNNILLKLLDSKIKLNPMENSTSIDPSFFRSKELTMDLLRMIIVSPSIWEQFKSASVAISISKMLTMRVDHSSARSVRNKVVRFLSFITVHHKDSISIICNSESKMALKILLLLEYELEYFGASIETTTDDLELQLLREGVQLLIRLGEELDFSVFENFQIAHFGFNIISKLCQLGGNKHLIGIAEQSKRLREWFAQAIRMSPSSTQR